VAALYDQLTVCENLLDGGVDPNIGNRVSIRRRRDPFVVNDSSASFSIHRNSSPFDVKMKETPLYLAAWYGHGAICQLLLERGADPNTRNIVSTNERLDNHQRITDYHEDLIHCFLILLLVLQESLESDLVTHYDAID
jgi:ankyrin repeat protein